MAGYSLFQTDKKDKKIEEDIEIQFETITIWNLGTWADGNYWW